MKIEMILQHIYLVFSSCLIACILGIPLGIYSYYHKKAGRVIMTVADIMQTIPTLAVMGLLMIIFGTNSVTVIIALCIYLILPIIQNTYTGLCSVKPVYIEVAEAVGMSKKQRLLKVEFPLASPFIITGIRIAAVTGIGVAVFGVFVGGGGLGTILYKGVRVQDMSLILKGTAALVVMSICIDSALGVLEKNIFRSINNEK